MSDARSAYQRGHNVDAAINVHGFTGDAPRIWSREINTSEADVHDVDKFSHGGTPSHFIEQQVEVLQAGSCAGL